MPNEDDNIEESLEDEFEEKFQDDVIDDELEKEIENIAQTSGEEPLETISISDIPIKIQIEVSRFEVSLEELSRMEPGYKLPIEINPRIVHLTTSGKVIGKGEIIEIGDTIGVKILELYK